MNNTALVAAIGLGVLLSEGRSVELAPGWPVYRADSTVVMSQTVPGFGAEVRRITNSETLTEREPRIEIDGQGKVWMQWLAASVVEREEEQVQLQVHLAELDEAGIVGTPDLVVPAGAYGWLSHSIAKGPDGRLWCASQTATGQVWDDYSGDNVFPDEYPPLAIHPCADEPRALDSSMRPGSLAFLGKEPVIIPLLPLIRWEDEWIWWEWWSMEGTLPLRFATSGEEVYLDPALAFCCYWDSYATALSKAGTSLVVLWETSYAFPGPTGGHGEDPTFATIVQPDSSVTRTVANVRMSYGDSFHGGRDHYYYNYSRALGIGSDGPDRVVVLSVEDEQLSGPPAFPVYRTDEAGFYTADPVVQVQALETPSLDTVDEWTLGYDRRGYREDSWPPPITAAITANHEAVGLALWRDGNLDLWILIDSSWYGPYSIASDVEAGVPAIAVDGKGRYWMAWTRNKDIYTTMVTPEELGLESPTSISGPEIAGPVPAGTSLAPARPNPFNASTLISYSVGSPGQVSLIICNALGQVVDTVVDRLQPAGSYSVSWNAAAGLSSGVYLARLVTPDAMETRKLMLLR